MSQEAVAVVGLGLMGGSRTPEAFSMISALSSSLTVSLNYFNATPLRVSSSLAASE